MPQKITQVDLFNVLYDAKRYRVKNIQQNQGWIVRRVSGNYYFSVFFAYNQLELMASVCDQFTFKFHIQTVRLPIKPFIN